MIPQQLENDSLTQIPVAKAGQRFKVSFTITSIPSMVFFYSIPIIAGFLLLTMFMRAGGLVSAQVVRLADPFAAYQDILPGQSAAGLEAFTCRQQVAYPPVPVCDILPEDGTFHLITVTTQDELILDLSFFSDSLQLGSLMQAWGDPDTTDRSASGRGITMSWDHSAYQVKATILPFLDQPHVRLVTLTLSPEYEQRLTLAASS